IPALSLLWDKCCSDDVVVRTGCCEALVALVTQNHADFNYVMNGILNLIPSARNIQGLIKSISKLLQMQALGSEQMEEVPYLCPYTIRNPPHPYIVVLENRPDSWPLLLQQISAIFQQPSERLRASVVLVVAPFLNYLYCEPLCLRENSELRLSLLKVLLQFRCGEEKEEPSLVEQQVLRLLFNLVPHLQINNLAQVTEAAIFLRELSLTFLRHASFWKSELSQLSLQLLCVCEVSLNIAGELSSLVLQIQMIATKLPEVTLKILSPPCMQELPTEALILLMPLLQIVSSAVVMDCIYDSEVTADNHNLAVKILDLIRSLDVPHLISVLMFKLGQPLQATLYQAILYTLPSLGTHKVCVAQILRALQMLWSTAKLKAISLRLMTILWEKQDRVYPELQKFMALLDVPSMSLAKEDQWEQMIAKAACIRDICKKRSYQHGADMLAAISKVLNECTRADQATPAVLVLQGLHALCQTEVVDIRSTWYALSPKLCCDTRPLVVKALTELFALVPALNVKSVEYEVVIRSFPCSLKNSLIASSAYKALSAFSTEEFTVLHLPEQFFSSLVNQELSTMPRGVYHSALRGGAVRSDQGKTVSGIPSFMLKTYEKNKQPGLKSGLAAGLLLCYDLHIQTDRDGKPINRFLVSRGRSYQQMLAALIHEVPIQPSEWHKSILLPQAWLGFMTRTYQAVLQGRQAELEMQQKHGKDDPEELQYKQFISWLWVRDLLTDVVKSASKDSPVVQGNSILALTGLAVTVAKYESSLPAESDDVPEIGCEILLTQHWISMVVETLLSIVDNRYRPKGRIFPWFQHRSYSGENKASAIARSCATTALTLLVPVLITSRRESIEEVLSILTSGLPGKPSADESQAVQFHTGLATGMFLSRLYEERVSDVSGQKMNLLLMKSLDALEKCCFDTSLEYNTGAILGVGLVISLMSHSSQTESRVHVSITLDKLCNRLDESATESRTLQEVLAYSVACVTVSAFNAGIKQANEVEEIMNKLRSLTEQNQQTSGFALALGTIVHGLAVCGHGKAEDLNNRLLSAWLKILLAELKSDTIQSSQFQSKLNEVIRAITQTISFSGVIGLQSNAAYSLGHLHLTNMSFSQSRTSVPPDFGYLPENSFIRCAVNYIIDAGKRGPESFPPQMMKVLLGPIAACGNSYQYPPVNWAAILSPLMRLNFGEGIQRGCTEIAVTQAQTSQSAAMFLGMWLAPPLVHSLNLEMRKYLSTSVASWMKPVPEDKLQTFVEVLAVQHFTAGNREKSPHLCQSILRGLTEAMKVPNPAQNIWGILSRTAERIFEMLPNQIQINELNLYIEISKCLSELGDDEIDRITQVTKDTIVKTAFVRAELVSQGRVPLLCFNDIIATTVGHSQRGIICWIMLQSFYQCRLISHQNTGVMKRMEWLLELMGHIRNVAYGSTPVQSEDTVDFLLNIFAAAVTAWSDHATPLLLGVRASSLPWSEEERFDGKSQCFGSSSLNLLCVQQCLRLLPCTILLLLTKEPWKSHTQKFIDWLFNMVESPKEAVPVVTLNTLKATLLALRFLPEFKKKATWTRAYGW
uniref:Focadhesin n=1 Tax=Callorhinchus milii TaxID=7868 RepID=A0A4W3IGD6_CALMI